ncbi:MAG: hypothetical protein AMXMBFR46_22190 [Acidimicrobiia bacterium]
MRSIDATDLAIAIQDDNVELRMGEVGGMTASFISLKAGADLGPALVGLEGDLCPCPHWGYMLEGRLKMRAPDGDSEYEAGQAFYWGPGHAPVALTDCRYVDFSPTDEFAAVIRHITGG